MLRVNTLGGLLVTRAGREEPFAVQPRRLAVLALIARAGARGITRDKLLALLWPDMDDETGRKALSHALYALRRDLEVERLFEGTQDLRLSAEAATCDAVEFDAAVSSGELERAAWLYHGPFLDGFRLSGAPNVERWADDERVVLAHRYAGVLEQLARQAATRGDHGAAVVWWRRLAAQDPLNSRTAVELMEALLVAGDRSGALQHARIYEVFLQQELDLPPDREVVELAERIRREAGSQSAAPATAAHDRVDPVVPEVAVAESEGGDENDDEDGSAGAELGELEQVGSVPEPDPAPGPAAQPSRPRRLRWAVSLAVLICSTVALGALAVRGSSPAAGARGETQTHSRPVIAVGHIEDYSAVGQSGQALSDMLATNLARTEGLRVISTQRLYAALPAGAAPQDVGEAARAAGAGALIDGSLYPMHDGTLRLDLRRFDLRSGVVLSAFSFQAPDLFALADAATAHLAADLGLNAPVGSLASVSTHSAIAYGLYKAGLETYFNGEPAAASSLFGAALEEDSTFAMAAFYMLVSRTDGDAELRRRVGRLASRAGARERLTIRAYVAALETDPQLQVFADSLVSGFPDEVEGYLYTGMARFQAGNYPTAIHSLRRAIAMDSISLKARRLPCNACTAMTFLISAYERSDSLAAAEREARWWVGVQPNSAEAWRHLALTLLHADRGEEAIAAFERAAALNPRRDEGWAYLADHTMRRGDFARADSTLLATIRKGSSADVEHARDLLVFSLRNQGRLRDALAVAQELRAAAPTAPRHAAALQAGDLAQVLFELGRYRESAALLDSIGLWFDESVPATHLAAHRSWYLARSATSLARAGEGTAALFALADSVRTIGSRGAGVRGRVQHHFVRGLALAASNREADATDEMRRAVYSPNFGFLRANVEIALLLERQERMADAIPLLQAALRSSPYTATHYVTWTEIHDLLGRAWDAAGNADSANHHYRLVTHAWRNADLEFQPRRAAIDSRLATLRRTR